MTDVYKRYLRPNSTEKGQMTALYLSTLGFGTLGTAIALALIRAEGILDTWWILQGIFAGGMLGLFLLGMVSLRATNPAAIIGVLAGLFVIAWMSTSPLLVDKGFLPESLRNPLDGNLTIIFGTTTIILVGLLATQLLPKRNTNP
jgi:SSS family solute:Na+ symporter